MKRNFHNLSAILGQLALAAAVLGILSGCMGQPAAEPHETQDPGVAATGTLSLPAGDPLPWWNDRVFYEVFVRSFYDSSGDGIGDIEGLIAKLDYLNDGDPQTSGDLGVTGLWLMPIHPSPSYHGYDVTDYRAINPEYGSLDSFQRLLAEAHRRGIAVIIDLVINHTSEKHPWFVAAQDRNSPYRDFYIWADADPAYKGPDGQTVWHRAGGGDFYYGFFWSGMPDLNYRSAGVTAEVQDIARFWLEDVGVDGFRLDAARHLIENGAQQMNTGETHQWWQGFRQFYKGVAPRAVTVGEIWDNSKAVAEYTRGDQFDLAFDFDLANAWVISASSKDARPARTVMKRDLEVFRPGQFATFLTNHDQNRVMTQLNGDAGKAKAAAALLLTSPGVPFLYYGEEIGMTGQKPDEQIRTPMQWDGTPAAGFTSATPWQAVNSDAQTVNVAAQSGDSASLLSTYRMLIQARNASPALRTGSAWPVETSTQQVYSLLRATTENAVLVVINMGPEPVSDYSLTLSGGPLQGFFPAISMRDGVAFARLHASETGGFTAYTPGELGPYSILLLKLK